MVRRLQGKRTALSGTMTEQYIFILERRILSHNIAIDHTASLVLLHATARAENGTFVQISAGDLVLHILCAVQGRAAGVCGARIVF